MTKNYLTYLKKLKENHKTAVKLAWINPDETVRAEFTNDIYDMSGTLSVNYQNGSRRSCTITLNNWDNKFPINYNNIWFNQKFKLWMGLYLDDATPFYIPQGVFYVTNPSTVYNPSTRTLKIQGADKWSALDGTLFGNLTGTYQTNIGTNLYDATRALLKMSRFHNSFGETNNVLEMLDPIVPLLDNSLLSKTVEVNGETHNVINCPYTARQEKGKKISDVFLEYATILGAEVYYNTDGRFVYSPLSQTINNINDTNKEILWDFNITEKQMMGIDLSYNFGEVFNDIIILGNIANGYQAKARIQNRNPMSDTCVQKIGLKSKEPFESNQYYSDSQCAELGKYYIMNDTIMSKTGSFTTAPIYHMDVNKFITLSTQDNNMKKEPFLVNGYTLQISDTSNMSLDVTSVKELEHLNDFGIVEVTSN